MSHIFDHDVMLKLTAARRLLLLEIRNSSAPVIRAPLAIMDFERVLDEVMPLGELDYVGRDPDNLRRTQ
jgi:hypothetical protein